jgi:hypothetical protein
MTPTVRLSQLPALRSYLSSSADLPRLHEALEVARASLVAAVEHLNTAKEYLAAAKVEVEHIKADAEKKIPLWEVRVRELEIAYEKATPGLSIVDYRRGVGEAPKHYSCYPDFPHYDPVAAEAYRPFEEAALAAEENARLSWQATTPEYKEAEARLKTATTNKDEVNAAYYSANRAIESINNKLASANLPEGILNLAPVVIEQLAGIDPASFDDDEFFFFVDYPDRVIAALLRGEIAIGCGGCESGYTIVHVAGVKVILDDEVRHPICFARSGYFDDSFISWINGIFPETFAGHRLHSLSPWAKNPIRDDVQAGLIAKIPSRAEDVKGLIMFGRGGTSKTTYAAASIIDMLTFRRVENPRATNLNYWRVKVPTWLREMEAYDSRSYKGPSVAPPDTAPHRLEETTQETGLPPILWIEELDKFKATANRLNMLYSLIDTVYEAGGTIVTTTNSRPAELEEHLGVPLYRRLTGVNDADDGKFVSVNGWVLPSREEKK